MEKKQMKIALSVAIIIAILVIGAVIAVFAITYNKETEKKIASETKNVMQNEKTEKEKESEKETKKEETKTKKQEEERKIVEDSDFDYVFLQLEDNSQNIIYSPLSIKYALCMLNERAGAGDSWQK